MYWSYFWFPLSGVRAAVEACTPEGELLTLVIIGEPFFNVYFVGFETRLFIIYFENDESGSLFPSTLGRDSYALCRFRVITSRTPIS